MVDNAEGMTGANEVRREWLPTDSSDSNLLQSETAETFAEQFCKAAPPNVLLDFALEQTDASNGRPTDLGPRRRA